MRGSEGRPRAVVHIDGNVLYDDAKDVWNQLLIKRKRHNVEVKISTFAIAEIYAVMSSEDEAQRDRAASALSRLERAITKDRSVKVYVVKDEDLFLRCVGALRGQLSWVHLHDVLIVAAACSDHDGPITLLTVDRQLLKGFPAINEAIKRKVSEGLDLRIVDSASLI